MAGNVNDVLHYYDGKIVSYDPTNCKLNFVAVKLVLDIFVPTGLYLFSFPNL